tara:strand:+ start:1463 stop:1783 length:321 start_codon:yes stop_codon:yes gene_type:complete
MASRNDIPPFAITDGKVSKQAKIDPKKLAPGKPGQVLIAGSDGKFAAGTLESGTTTTVTNTEMTAAQIKNKLGIIGDAVGTQNSQTITHKTLGSSSIDGGTFISTG